MDPADKQFDTPFEEILDWAQNNPYWAVAYIIIALTIVVYLIMRPRE